MEGKRVSSRAQRAGLIAAVAIVLGTLPCGLFAQAAIQFRVADDTGAAFTRGRATIIELERSALIENGSVAFENIPNGLWHISIRAIGFYPESLTVRTPVSGRVRTVNMHQMPQTLSVVPIVSHRDSMILGDIARRMRVAHGSLTRAEDLVVRNATLASDALGMATGFQRKSATVVQGRGGCRSVSRSDSLPPRGRRATKVVAIYLDGARLPGGLESLNRMVPPSDILAVEAYPDVISAPFIWRSNDACAVVAFWTKRPPPVTVGR
jgi:hypothetical protein